MKSPCEPDRRDPLPIDEVLGEIVSSLALTPALVLRAPTGAGKTTRVAPALLDSRWLGGSVVLLQPRRVAARAAARRIAFERGGDVGGEVGYAVRFDRKAGPRTRLLVMTEGVLLRRLQDDPFLDGIGAVVFDEFHERSLDADLALAMTRKVQRQVRPDLRIVVMSATLDPAPAARYLGGAPCIESRGRPYPVEVRNVVAAGGNAPLESAVAAALETALGQTSGDVLVFLPGLAEIRRVRRHLSPAAERRGLLVTEMYGDLPAEEQDAVLRRADRRKVVLSTNVAETSVTIDNITAVVDSGWARVLRFDPSVGMDRLERTRISRASADQRAGRAGRTAPGLCLRLWSAHDDQSLRAEEDPEIRRVDLARAVLELRAWGEPRAAAFEWFEAPDAAALAAAERVLEDLRAVDERGITDLGRTLARLPLPPRVARLLVEGRALGCPRRAALAAALLSERDVVRRDVLGGRPATGTHESDVLERVLLLERFADSRVRAAAAWPELNVGAARNVLQAADELLRLTSGRSQRRPDGDSQAGDDDALLRALPAAFPDRIARRRARGSERAIMVGGRGLKLASESVVQTAELFVCIDLDAGRRGERSETLVRQASAVEPQWLPTTRSGALYFDEKEERVVAVQRTAYRDLVLEEKPDASVDRKDAGRLLGEAAAAEPSRALALDDVEVCAFLARVRSLAQWMPELQLPVFEAAELAEIARELAAGCRSFAETRRAPLLGRMQARLTHEQLRKLDREAPERVEIPSGSRVRLHYEPGRAPVLAARIQELFGLGQAPRVAAGRIGVVVHLLAPNGRPQQMTEDLAGFWRNTYQEVRRELRARYPRHSWPQDPLSARPERKPGTPGRKR